MVGQPATCPSLPGQTEAAEGPAYLAGFAPDDLTGVPPKVPRSWRDVLGGASLAGFVPDVPGGIALEASRTGWG
jgi:hypothetical protein